MLLACLMSEGGIPRCLFWQRVGVSVHKLCGIVHCGVFSAKTKAATRECFREVHRRRWLLGGYVLGETASRPFLWICMEITLLWWGRSPSQAKKVGILHGYVMADPAECERHRCKESTRQRDLCTRANVKVRLVRNVCKVLWAQSESMQHLMVQFVMEEGVFDVDKW